MTREKLIPLVREIHRRFKWTYSARRMPSPCRKMEYPAATEKPVPLMELAGVAALQPAGASYFAEAWFYYN